MPSAEYAGRANKYTNVTAVVYLLPNVSPILAPAVDSCAVRPVGSRLVEERSALATSITALSSRMGIPLWLL